MCYFFFSAPDMVYFGDCFHVLLKKKRYPTAAVCGMFYKHSPRLSWSLDLLCLWRLFLTIGCICYFQRTMVAVKHNMEFLVPLLAISDFPSHISKLWLQQTHGQDCYPIWRMTLPSLLTVILCHQQYTLFCSLFCLTLM